MLVWWRNLTQCVNSQVLKKWWLCLFHIYPRMLQGMLWCTLLVLENLEIFFMKAELCKVLLTCAYTKRKFAHPDKKGEWIVVFITFGLETRSAGMRTCGVGLRGATQLTRFTLVWRSHPVKKKHSMMYLSNNLSSSFPSTRYGMEVSPLDEQH